MSRPRFYLPGVTSGARLVLPPAAAHHARNVLRLRKGDSIQVFDGQAHEFEAFVDKIDRRNVWVHALRLVDSVRESRLRLVIALPPLRSDLMSLVVQKCTELGATEIWPVITARTDVEGRIALHGARRERWKRIAIAAAEQCGRSVFPTIRSACKLEEMLARPFEGVRLLFAERGLDLISSVPNAPPAGVLLLIGPAGGLRDDETAKAVKAGFACVTLGPRLLRAETAAIVATALCQDAWGDLRESIRDS